MITTRASWRALTAGLLLSVSVACAASTSTSSEQSSPTTTSSSTAGRSYPDGAAIAAALHDADLGCATFDAEPPTSREVERSGIVSQGSCKLTNKQKLDIMVFASGTNRQYWLATALAMWCLDTRDPANPQGPNASIRPAPGPDYVHGANWLVMGSTTAPVPAEDIARATGGEQHTPDCLAAGAWVQSLTAVPDAADGTTGTIDPSTYGDQELLDQLLGERVGPPRTTTTRDRSSSTERG